MDKRDYQLPGGNRVALSKELADEFRQRFETVRENRMQLFLLSCAVRRKYLDKKTNKYSSEFDGWYQKNKMDAVFGTLSNFTRYASAGEVVTYVGTKTSNPDKYLDQLPPSVGALYEISMIMAKDEEAFQTCLHFTPARKTVDEPKIQWKTKKPALINKAATESQIRIWRQMWDDPPPPKQPRADKRTLRFVTITCNGELYDFDKKTGEKIGCLDLPEVEDFLHKIKALMTEDMQKQFLIEDNLEALTTGYYKRKDQYDVTKNIKRGKSDKSGRYA